MSNMANKEVVVVIGPGQIGQAIARRVGFGKHVLLADYGPRGDPTARGQAREHYAFGANRSAAPGLSTT